MRRERKKMIFFLILSFSFSIAYKKIYDFMKKKEKNKN